MAVPSFSPVPPADGVVSEERLGALLGLGAEYDELDFKTKLELSSQRDEVELAKDIGAMQVKGGYIVIGVDANGTPTGDMDNVDESPFDPANLVPKMQRFIDGAINLASSALTIDGHKVIVLCVSPSPLGCAFFRVEGTYPHPRRPGETKIVFRASEVFWRQNTSSVRISGAGLEEIIERRFLARRDELLREWAAAQHALSASTGGTQARAAPTFALSADDLSAEGVELIRAGDEVGLRQLIDDGRARVRTYIETEQLGDDQLPSLLDSIACLTAVCLSYGPAGWFELTLQLFVDAYALAADSTQVQQFGYSTHISPTAKAPRVWLAIIERVFSLGGFAVRREAWDSVRELTTQLPEPLRQGGYEANWLRHALTMASRARHFADGTGEDQQIGLIDLARDDALRLACLRSDGASDEDVLTSIAQFDLLSNLVAIDDAASDDMRVFYPNFARFRQDRVDPVAARLVTEAEMRASLFRGSDTDLAAALTVIGHRASYDGMRYGGFTGWHGAVAQFIGQHPKSQQAHGR